MRSPNYVKFVDYLVKESNNIDKKNTEYLSPLEKFILILSQVKSRYYFLYFWYISIIPILAITAFLIPTPNISPGNTYIQALIGMAVGLITFYFLRKRSFLYYTKPYLFTLLSRRLESIENYIDNKNLNVTWEKTIELIKSPTPLEAVKKKTASQVYWDFYQRPKQKNEKLISSEKLFLLFFLVQEGYDFKTDDMDLNHILGALLNLSPDSMKNNLTKVNKLRKYIDNEKGLYSDDINFIKDTLEKLEEKRASLDLFEKLRTKAYNPH